MEITDRKVGDACVVAVHGRLDSAGSEPLAQRLQQLIEGGERRLVIDGERLDYISSAGLRVLLVAAKRLKPLRGTIVLSTLKPHIYEVFEITGFTSIFPIHRTVDQATQP